MGLIPEQEHLTVIDDRLESSRRRTWPGMAHWAGSGAAGKTCRECQLWTGCGDQSGYYAKRGNRAGMIKPRACEKHRDLMQGVTGPAIPHDAAACRYFIQHTNPPPISAKS
jgi:hypothetical protein